MTALLSSADDILRGRAAQTEDSAHRAFKLLIVLVLCGLFYGAVMGSFAVAGQLPRLLQILYSAAKVPLLVTVTFLISLPSYFVLNTLLGVRGDWSDVLRALISTQAVLTIILSSLAPFTALWYLSFADYSWAIIVNAILFGIASVAAQMSLRKAYRPLVGRNPRHRVLLRIWLITFAFVGIQMGWVLRPFIGQPDRPTTFFRSGAWGNAYVELAHIAMRAARHALL